MEGPRIGAGRDVMLMRGGMVGLWVVEIVTRQRLLPEMQVLVIMIVQHVLLRVEIDKLLTN